MVENPPIPTYLNGKNKVTKYILLNYFISHLVLSVTTMATQNNNSNGNKDVNLEGANSLREKALANAKDDKERAKLQEQVVGSNGYALGQTFTITGATWVQKSINDNSVGYAAFTTEEGAELSIKQVMGISSLNGYETSGSFVNESGKDKTKPEKEQVTAHVVDGFDFSDVFQPSTRKYLDFLDKADQGEFNGKTLTYLGVVVRPFVAKKDSTSNGQQYKAGMQRTIAVKLWGMN